MNIYDIIMQAADRITVAPQDFCYTLYRTDGCGTPSCALGWIGFFAQETKEQMAEDLNTRALAILGVRYWDDKDQPSFEGRMRDILYYWSESAESCASTLRLYAAKYHAPTKPQRTDAELVKHWVAVVRQIHLDETKQSEELVW